MNSSENKYFNKKYKIKYYQISGANIPDIPEIPDISTSMQNGVSNAIAYFKHHPYRHVKVFSKNRQEWYHNVNPIRPSEFIKMSSSEIPVKQAPPFSERDTFEKIGEEWLAQQQKTNSVQYKVHHPHHHSLPHHHPSSQTSKDRLVRPPGIQVTQKHYKPKLVDSKPKLVDSKPKLVDSKPKLDYHVIEYSRGPVTFQEYQAYIFDFDETLAKGHIWKWFYHVSNIGKWKSFSSTEPDWKQQLDFLHTQDTSMIYDLFGGMERSEKLKEFLLNLYDQEKMLFVCSNGCWWIINYLLEVILGLDVMEIFTVICAKAAPDEQGTISKRIGVKIDNIQNFITTYKIKSFIFVDDTISNLSPFIQAPIEDTNYLLIAPNKETGISLDLMDKLSNNDGINWLQQEI